MSVLSVHLGSRLFGEGVGVFFPCPCSPEHAGDFRPFRPTAAEQNGTGGHHAGAPGSFLLPPDLVALRQHVLMPRELSNTFLVPDTCVCLPGSGCHFLTPAPPCINKPRAEVKGQSGAFLASHKGCTWQEVAWCLVS